MSFTPKAELPGDLTDNTPGRSTKQSPTEVLPLVRGRGRVVARPITPVLHWKFQNTKTQSIAYFSCAYVLCLGPVDEFLSIIVNGKAYHGIYKKRTDYPGTEYVEQVVSKAVPETFRLYWGTEAQLNPTGYIQSLAHSGEMSTATHPRYAGCALLVVTQMEAGNASSGKTPAVPKIEIEVFCRTTSAFDYGHSSIGHQPIGIVRDLLTLPRGGGRLPAAVVDDTEWDAAAALLHTTGIAGLTGEELWTSFVFDKPRALKDQAATVMEYFHAYLRERAGRLQIGWSPADGSTADPTGLREITLHHMADEPQLEPEGLDDVPTKVIVTGLDWLSSPALQEDSAEAMVPYARRLFGEERPPLQLSRPGYVSKAQLKACANMEAAGRSNPTMKVRLTVLRQYATHADGVTPLRPGDLFTLDWEQLELDVVMRVLERSKETAVKVELLAEVERGAFPRPYNSIPAGTAAPAPEPPADLVRYAIAQLPPDLSDAADTRVAALVERADTGAQGFHVEFAPTDSFPGQQLEDGNVRWAVACQFFGALSSGLSDATITVDGVGVDWDAIVTSRSTLEKEDDQLLAFHAGEWFSIGTVTPLGGGQYTLAVSRARLASLPADHADNDVLFIIPRGDLIGLTHADFATVESGGTYDVPTATKYFKIRPFNAAGNGNWTASTTCVLRDPTPDQVTGLAVTFVGKAAQLVWSAVAGALVNEYQVYRATGPGYADEALVAEVSGTSFMDIVPAYGTTYRWRVRAMGTDETDGVYSDPVTGAASTLGESDLDAGITDAIADALDLAAEAIADAATAQGTADGKVKTFIQATAPTAEGVGDLWVDSDDNNLYRWSGSAWVDIQDAGIPAALDAAGIAQAEAESKIVTFYATTAPTAEAVGDLWVDTDDGNRLYRWNGSSWVDVQGIRSNAPATPSAPSFNSEDSYLADDGTALSYIQINLPAMPSGAALMNVLYRRNGSSSWIVADQVSLGGGVARIDDLSVGVAYQFAVVGLSNFGISSNVSTVLDRTAPNGIGAPSTPTGLTATGYLENITLDWNDNTEKNLVAYEIWRGTTSGSLSYLTTVSASTFVDTQVSASTTYYYAIKAKNRGGSVSGLSTEASAARGEQSGGGGSNYTLTLTATNTGVGGPTPTGGGSYAPGTVVNISTPATDNGWNFDQWSGAWPDIDQVQNPASTDTAVLMSKDITLNADYSSP